MKKGSVMVFAALLLAGCGGSDRSGQSNAPASLSQTAQAPSASDAALMAGIAQLRNGQVTEAIHSFDTSIRENPRNFQTYMILGQTYMHLKDYNRAIDTFTVATAVEPDNGEVKLLLATNYGLAGNYRMAKLEAEKCLAIFQKEKDETNFKRAVALLQGLPENIKTK